ncbi:MAG: MFS transporter [Bacteroidales bacterium]
MQKLKGPILFVVLIGFVSLFSDMVYEGARGVTGPFLESLKANAFIVGLFAGLGEFIGYGMRLFSGLWADKTQKYWVFVFSGYAINLLSVPLMALAGYWQIAVVLMMMERLGKAIRTPSRDALMAAASSEIGRGWAFGLHEALDQIGATLGPLIMMAVLYFSHDHYPSAFAWTLIPALVALSLLVVSKTKEPPKQVSGNGKYRFEKMSDLFRHRPFIFFLIGAGLLAAGFTDFPLIAFHIKHHNLATDSLIPALYAMAMIVDAAAALWLGKLYDRKGILALMVSTALSLLFPVLAFSSSFPLVVLGMVLWGIGMGAQESILRAALAGMAPEGKTATVYGIFNTVYGLAWFAGSALMGLFYNVKLSGLIIFSIVAQLLALATFFLIKKQEQHAARS